MNELGGYRNDIGVALTGLDIEAKAQLVEDAFWEACPYKPEDFASVTTRVVRTDKADPATNEEAVAVLAAHASRTPTSARSGRAVSNAMVELGLATIPGFFGVGGGPRRGPAVRRVPAGASCRPSWCRSTSWSSAGERTVVDSVAPPAPATVDGGARARPDGAAARRPDGARRRSGASSAPARATRAATPTSACSPAPTRRGRGSTASSPSSGCASCCPRRPTSPSTATGSPALRSLNFVIHGLLAGGRGGLDPPGRAGQEPRRVAAGAGGRRARRRCWPSAHERGRRRRDAAALGAVRRPRPILEPGPRARADRPPARAARPDGAPVRGRIRDADDGRARGAPELLAAHALRPGPEPRRARAGRGRPQPVAHRPGGA